jgi:uncharacterized membrane protein
MVQMAVLLAVLLLMELTGLGMFKTAGLELTIMQVPVILGAIVLGPLAGAILGLGFGLLAFWECFGKSIFGAALLQINPFYTFLVCVPTRMLMGYLCGLVFKAMDKKLAGTKTNFASYLVAALSGALLNTILFMGILVACFYRTAYIQGFVSQLGASNVLVFVLLFVGVQGLVEALLCATIGSSTSKALRYALHKK